MQIGNIHWKQIRLETFFQIGNIILRLETVNLDWKQNSQIGNICLKTGLIRLRTNLFPIDECFRSKKIVSNVLILFPIQFLCFQSKLLVSNLKRLFPMSFFCFQSQKIVSFFCFQSFLCFQSNLFPIYVSNLHITVIT